MVDYELIGKRIKSRRKQFGMTQEVLAEECGLTIEYLSKIENGKVRPTIDTLNCICESLDLDMSNLFSNVSIGLNDYNVDEIILYYQKCKPEIKIIALDLIKKLSAIS